MLVATCDVALNFSGVACQTLDVLSTVEPAGLVFQVMPVSVQVSVVTRSAEPGAVGAPTATGMSRTVAAAGAVARPLRSNFRYDSRLLSVAADVSFFTPRSVAVPKL